jgi:ABC-2 type transport system permease protein
VFASNAVYLIPLLTVVSIGVLLSTVTRNSAAAVVGTLGVLILLVIVAQIPGIEAIKPYLLDEQFENWHGLLRTPTDWAPIAHSAWVCALYAGPALFAGYLTFLRRDVAGG